MNAPAYDTLGAVRGLREAGFEEVQAEAIVVTVGRAMSENVATKSDVAGVNANTAEFRADVDAKFAGVDSRFAEVRTEMAEFRPDVDSKFAGVDSRFANVDSRFASVDSQFAAVRTEMAGFRPDVDSKFAGVDSRFSDVRTEMAEFRAYLAEEFKALHRQLWVMGVGIVAVTVTLVKLVV